jgi:hypothetical protein
MPALPQFDLPAFINDFPEDPGKHAKLVKLWNQNATAWTRQAILGNSWNQQFSSNQTFYYNPLLTDIPPGTSPVMIHWNAMPGRIGYYFPNLSLNDQQSLADTGYAASTGQTFGQIPPPNVICNQGTGSDIAYGPYGPRGWQDEYCEWSVLRDANNKIIRVDFACENPEYWNMLWRIDPFKVHSLYKDTLDVPHIPFDDLVLTYNNQHVKDQFGNPVYNPLNKWNSGTVRTATSGGVMHLTSTPNTLQTEMGLAGGATVLRTIGNANATALLCCSQYGQPRRNSDPTIGQNANIAVSDGNIIALANPIGLYIQMPSFGSYQTPDGTPAETFWTVKRGQKDPLPGFPANSSAILHATFEVPASYGYTVSDIKINDQPINWAAQIATTFDVALFPLPIPTTNQQDPQKCVVFLDPPQAAPQPLQLFYGPAWDAQYGTPVANPVGGLANLAGNTIVAPLFVNPGKTYDTVLTCATLGTPSNLAVQFFVPGSTTPDASITASPGSVTEVNYDVPGNSYPSTANAIRMRLIVASSAAAGPRDVVVTNGGQAVGVPAAAFLYIET